MLLTPTLEICHIKAPAIYRLAHLAYSAPSLLVANTPIIPSASGVHKDNSLGLLSFALAIDDLARPISSPLNLWCLDDATIGGRCISVINDLQRLVVYNFLLSFFKRFTRVN